MATVPTGKMERELRKLYLQWASRMPTVEYEMSKYLREFADQSVDLIERMGGEIARLGVSAGFPAPKRLDLAEWPSRIYSELETASIQASIMTGLNARDAARAMYLAGVEQAHWRLQRLARTETVNAYWKNQRAEAADLGLVLLWSMEDGPRTCEWCRERDGLVAEDGCRDHPNGRCTLLPMLPSRVKYKGSVSADGSIYYDPEWESKYQPVTGLNVELAAPPSKPPRVVDMDKSTKTYQRLVDQSIERRGDFRFILDDDARYEALLQNWYESEQAVKRVASNLKQGIDPFDGLDEIDGWRGFVDHYTGVPKGLDKIAGGEAYVFTEDDILDHVRSAAEWLNKQPPQSIATVTRPKYDTLRDSAGTDLPGLYKGLSIDPDVDLNSLFKVGNQFDLNASSFTSSGGTASSYAKNYRVIDESLPATGNNLAPMQGVFLNLEDGVGVPLTKNPSFGGDLQKANEWLVSGKVEVVRIDETLHRKVVVIRMVP